MACTDKLGRSNKITIHTNTDFFTRGVTLSLLQCRVAIRQTGEDPHSAATTLSGVAGAVGFKVLCIVRTFIDHEQKQRRWLLGVIVPTAFREEADFCKYYSYTKLSS